jgi:hypothetical protein
MKQSPHAATDCIQHSNALSLEKGDLILKNRFVWSKVQRRGCRGVRLGVWRWRTMPRVGALAGEEVLELLVADMGDG